MYVNLIILVIAGAANVLIGLFTLFRDPRNIIYRLFGLLTLTLVGWTTANYFSLLPISLNHIFLAVKTVLVFVALQNTFYLLFVLAYTPHRKIPKLLPSYLFLSVITILLGIFPGYFTSYVPSTVHNAIIPKPGPAIALFIIHTAFTIVLGVRQLFVNYRRAYGIAKKQYGYLMFATATLFLLTPITNFILPNVFGISELTFLSPLYTLLFAGVIGYAIVAKRLFDIKTAVARSVAYVLSFGFVGLVYGVLTFVLAASFSSNKNIDFNQQVFYISFALLTALLYPYVKHFFDRVTNRLFYRDAYDPQQLLDQLNRILVAQVDLEPLLQEVASLIVRNIKADYCAFLIRETSYFPQRVIGTTNKELKPDDMALLRTKTLELHKRVVIKENLDEAGQGLRRLMNQYDIAILARLVTTVEYEVEGLGYLLLGSKKSGNPYTLQDEKIVQIIANELVIAIQNGLRYEEIEQFNVTLQQKIDTATKQLQKTNHKLQALDETKDEFISMASHQLRTPLTSVKGYLSMVLEGDAGETTDMQRKLLEQAFISSQRMVYLIADLLNVSRLHTGKFVIEAVPTNLADVVEGEVKQLQDTAKSRGLELTYDKPAAFPTLMLDETKVRQVIMNFMDNAIYYTPHGGHIKVVLKETDKTVEYTVSDDGIGVPHSERHHLFAKFYRAGNARKARPDGTGLGLFMSKKVIVAQGGAIIFTSEEGKGSTFGFSFEKAKLLPLSTTNPESKPQ